MSEHIRTTYKRAARVQTVVCGSLFAVFSFVYLYVFQRDVLEALHFSLAHGKTHFVPLASAVILTLILILIRWGINSLLGLKGGVRALSYFPSCLILGALTDVGRTVYMQDYHTPWSWLLPLLLLAYILLGYWLRRIFRTKLNEALSPLSLMNSNLCILLALCLMTVLTGNSNRTFHHELQAERYLRSRQYEEALTVGQRSLEASRTLTALRAYALSNAGLMGERLFEYPQYYRSGGLFFADDSLHTLRYTNDSVYDLLGTRPDSGANRLGFLKNACYGGTGKHTVLDYYLSALLLEKEVDSFAAALSDFYDPQETLPRYYREAVTMYRDTHPNFAFQPADSVMARRYSSYKARRKTFASPAEERNLMRREYGDTYWWYFDYQK